MKLILKISIVLTILYASMIFYLSSLSNPPIPKAGLNLINYIIHSLQHSDYLFLFAPFYPFIKQQDKLLHMILYSGFGILLFLTMKGIYKPLFKAAALALLLGVMYGASDEFHQMFVSGRTASFMDLTADAAGLLFAQVMVFIIYAIVTTALYIYSHSRLKS